MHKLSGEVRVAKAPTTECVAGVLRARPSDVPVDVHKRYVGDRAAKKYDADPKALADWVEYWLPDGGPQMMVAIIPRRSGAAVVVARIEWLGPEQTQDRIASYHRQQLEIESALKRQCGVDFSNAERSYSGKDVQRYFRR